MATEEEGCLEKYKRGLEDLKTFTETRKVLEKAASGIDNVSRYMNNHYLTKAIDDISSGFKYMRPEMKEGLTELLTFLKSDGYYPTMHVYEAVERVHNSISSKEGCEDLTKEIENMLGMLAQKIKEKS